MAYKKDFLGGDHLVDLPILDKAYKTVFDQVDLDPNYFYLEYQNFSLLQNPIRKFPFYTISNIDGVKFRKLGRKDSWKMDQRIDKQFQFGNKLYSADKSDFDKGHMTKREDVQWGDTDDEARDAAESTFFYTNAIPQLDKLNRGIWSKIEKYILHTETVKKDKKIVLLTGPVLSDRDPVFVTPVDGEDVQIPTLFWKIIYYTNRQNELCRTAFIVNQANLLQERRIVAPVVRGDEGDEGHAFMDFKDADIYQTEVSFIESLTNMYFQEAKEYFQDDRPRRLIVEQTEVRGEEMFEPEITLFKNLML